MKLLSFALCIVLVAWTKFCSAELELETRTTIMPHETIQLNLDEIILLDVRTDKEWNAGHIRGATHLPLRRFKDDLPNLITNKKKPVVLYCASGGRAIAAAKYMRNLGYKAVPVTKGGYIQILSAGMHHSVDQSK